MNTNISISSTLYMALINKQPAACFAIMHFPHGKVNNFKRDHRLVVLPDYQGFGLGHSLSSIVAQHYVDLGFRFIITSNTKSLYKQRKRDPRWRVTRIGRVPTNQKDALIKSTSVNKLTISYEYMGEKNNKPFECKINGENYS